MHQDDVRFGLFEYVSHAHQYPCSNVVQVLSLLHDVQVVVGYDVEQVKYLVEHLPVLPGHAYEGGEVLRVFFEGLYQRGHFDGFRSGPEDEHDGFHGRVVRRGEGYFLKMPQKSRMIFPGS